MLSSNSTKWSRTELLVRLQRDRWKYCNQCWALHPYSAWMALRSNWMLCQQPCSSKCGLVGIESRKCSSLYTGEVQMCPCQAITFHQSQHIAEYCRGSRSDLHLDHSSFKVARRHDGGRKILHSCSVTTNEATLYVFSRIMVCYCCNHLHVTNQSSLRVHDPCPSYFVRVARSWYCPELWIEKFVGEAGLKFNCGIWGSVWRSDSRPLLGLTSRMLEERVPLEIVLQRDLGPVRKWPSIRWKLHSCKLAPSMSHHGPIHPERTHLHLLARYYVSRLLCLYV